MQPAAVPQLPSCVIYNGRLSRHQAPLNMADQHPALTCTNQAGQADGMVAWQMRCVGWGKMRNAASGGCADDMTLRLVLVLSLRAQLLFVTRVPDPDHAPRANSSPDPC